MTRSELRARARECFRGIRVSVRWFPVEERLPEGNGHYLVARSGRVEMATWVWEQWNGVSCVTHWAELPEPPAEAE